MCDTTTFLLMWRTKTFLLDRCHRHKLRQDIHIWGTTTFLLYRCHSHTLLEDTVTWGDNLCYFFLPDNRHFLPDSGLRIMWVWMGQYQIHAGMIISSHNWNLSRANVRRQVYKANLHRSIKANINWIQETLFSLSNNWWNIAAKAEDSSIFCQIIENAAAYRTIGGVDVSATPDIHRTFVTELDIQ